MRAWAAGFALALAAGCGAGREARVIDRIEEGRAVLVDEEGGLLAVGLEELPAGAGEGDVLVDGSLAPGERRARAVQLEALRRRLAAGDDGADLALEGR